MAGKAEPQMPARCVYTFTFYFFVLFSLEERTHFRFECLMCLTFLDNFFHLSFNHFCFFFSYAMLIILPLDNYVKKPLLKDLL